MKDCNQAEYNKSEKCFIEIQAWKSKKNVLRFLCFLLCRSACPHVSAKCLLENLESKNKHLCK